MSNKYELFQVLGQVTARVPDSAAAGNCKGVCTFCELQRCGQVSRKRMSMIWPCARGTGARGRWWVGSVLHQELLACPRSAEPGERCSTGGKGAQQFLALSENHRRKVAGK